MLVAMSSAGGDASSQLASLTSPEPVIPIAPAAEPPAWTWRWSRWSKGEGKTFLWVCVIHGLALLGIGLFPSPGWALVGVAYLVFWLGAMGTTVAYHRALAHHAVKLHPVLEYPLVVLALLNGSGAPSSWCANHRLHHAHADSEGDISSPRLGGFWWAHLRWLWQAPSSPIGKWAPDLDRGFYRGLLRLQVPLLAVSLFCGLPFGWAAFFWMGPIRLAFALHAQCITNSLSHLRRGALASEDSSSNHWWLAPFQALQGENWHANHHAIPWSARLGWNWRQVDLGWVLILAAERIGLAKNVRRPGARIAARAAATR
jgi:fatty-acid desaturase